MDDDEIRALLTRLGRRDASGAVVIERADVLAAGADFVAIMGWITDHDGVPDAAVQAAPRRGLHGARLHDGSDGTVRTPLRYVLPAAALSS